MGNPTHGMLASEPAAYDFNTSTPVSNTESGIGELLALNHGTTTASSTYVDLRDDTLTAYVARQAILLAEQVPTIGEADVDCQEHSSGMKDGDGLDKVRNLARR